MTGKSKSVAIRDRDDLFRLQEYTTCVQYNAFEIGDIRAWINKYCRGTVHISAAFLYFEEEADAVLFKLSNGG